MWKMSYPTRYPSKKWQAAMRLAAPCPHGACRQHRRYWVRADILPRQQNRREWTHADISCAVASTVEVDLLPRSFKG